MQNENTVASEGLNIAPAGIIEHINRRTVWTVAKRAGDFGSFVAGKIRDMKDATAAELQEAKAYWEQYWLGNQKPYEVITVDGNLMVTAGITLLWTLLIGGGGTAFSNANARLGVGNSNTAEAIGQVDLQGGSTLRKAMNSTFPSVAAAVITFQSTFSTAEANFTWLEVGTFNSGAGATMLNRKVPVGGLGTKASGASWTLTETITLS